MFKFRKQANSQAKRNAKVEPVTSLRWRKSWNWGFLLVPIIFAASYLAEAEQILPIRSIQLQGNFANLEQRQVEAALEKYIGQGFFSLDIHQLQQSIKESPGPKQSRCAVSGLTGCAW